MKKMYEKPDAEYIKLLVHDMILDIFSGDLDIEDDEGEGI